MPVHVDKDVNFGCKLISLSRDFLTSFTALTLLGPSKILSVTTESSTLKGGESHHQ